MGNSLEISYWTETELEVDKVRDDTTQCTFSMIHCFAGNRYKVSVFTGKKRGAGTDADVYITLYGDMGETGAIMLDDKKNNFEAGK